MAAILSREGDEMKDEKPEYPKLCIPYGVHYLGDNKYLLMMSFYIKGNLVDNIQYLNDNQSLTYSGMCVDHRDGTKMPVYIGIGSLDELIRIMKQVDEENNVTVDLDNVGGLIAYDFEPIFNHILKSP